MKIGFIGLGNMASAMIGGILKKELYSAEDIIGSDKSEDSVQKAAKIFGIHTTTDNLEVAQAADVLILAVKPQFFPEVIAEIKGAVREETLIISIAPGKTMEWIMEHFGRELKLVRCMPNTPALVGEGCTGFCCYKLVSEEEQAQAALGSAKMVLETGKHPGELKDMVCSPAGTTIQAVKVLEETGFRASVMDAVEACIEKSRSM